MVKKKDLNDFYSKKRYILIDKETGKPLSFERWSIMQRPFLEINETKSSGKFEKIVVKGRGGVSYTLME